MACFREGAGLPRWRENQLARTAKLGGFARNYTAFSSRFRFNEGRTFKNRPVVYFSEGARLPRGQWDEETGNFYYGARYYDPKISTWLSVDPLAHIYPSLSSYNFVANSPLSLVDPNGMNFKPPVAIVNDGEFCVGEVWEDADGVWVLDENYVWQPLEGTPYEGETLDEVQVVDSRGSRSNSGQTGNSEDDMTDEPSESWWNSVSTTIKTSRTIARMDNRLGQAEWSVYSANKMGGGRTNITITNGLKASTTYTLPAGPISTQYTAESGTAGFSFGLISLGMSIDGTLSSSIGTSKFGIEHSYRPSPEVIVVGALLISTATLNFETYPILIPLL